MMNDELLKFENAYCKDVDENGKPIPTIVFPRENRLLAFAIDYILYTPKSLNLLQYLKLPIIDHVLPNFNYGSDHLALVCDFEFN